MTSGFAHSGFVSVAVMKIEFGLELMAGTFAVRSLPQRCPQTRVNKILNNIVAAERFNVSIASGFELFGVIAIDVNHDGLESSFIAAVNRFHGSGGGRREFHARIFLSVNRSVPRLTVSPSATAIVGFMPR